MENNFGFQKADQKIYVTFNGVHYVGDIPFLVFSNHLGVCVEIPVDKMVADHILFNLQTISFPSEKKVEPSEIDDVTGE